MPGSSPDRVVDARRRRRPHGGAGGDALELKQRLHDVTRLVSDWIWEVDSDLRLIYLSDRVFEAVGYHQAELRGHPFLDHVQFTDGGKAESSIARCLPFRNAPACIVSRDHRERQLLVSAVPVFCSESGLFKGFRGTAEDVTERRAAERALEGRDAVLQAINRAATVLLSSDDWRREMPELLALLGEASQSDRIDVFEAAKATAGETLACCRFLWSASDRPDPGTVHGGAQIPLGAIGLQGCEERFRAGKVVMAGRDDGGDAALVVPVSAGDAWWGFVRLRRAGFRRDWMEPEIDAMRTAAGLIGAAIHRHRFDQTLRASEARFSTAFHTGPDAMAIFRYADGMVLEVNHGFTQLTGHRREDVVGRSIDALNLWPDKAQRLRVLRTLHRRREVRDLEGGFRTRDGTERTGSLSARLVDFDGTLCVFAAARDITRRKLADDAIRKLSQAVEQSPVLVMITDTDGSIEYVNPRFEQVTGYTAAEVIGRTPAILKSGQTHEADYRAMWKIIESGGEWRGELCNRKKDGEHFWAAQSISPIRSADGAITHFVSVSEDITARRFYEERLRYQVSHDMLTDLPNRTLFFDRLPRALTRARRDGWSLTLMFIDLDGFKLINDRYGPDGGDEVLRQVAARLSAWDGPIDTVARLASDEFALLISEGGDRTDAAALVQDILALLAEPFRLGGDDVVIHASIGIAVFPDDGQDEYSLLKNADAAMVTAKELGGNTYRFFTPDMNARAANYISLGQDLRQALYRDEFELFYQPVVDAGTGMVVAAEALLRWRHPRIGLILPDDFVGLAEDGGLIEAIGAWVIGEACRQNRAWRDQGLGALRIAVNVSSRQLQRGMVVATVFSALNEAGLPPSSLDIEITESAFLAEDGGNTDTLHKLRTMGIGIALDDFGTGYSSLGYLRRLPLTALKIDRAFVQDVATDRDTAAIAEAIIDMAHRLRLKVVAEGIENEAQLGFLRDKGCEMMQGYHFSQPLPAGEFTNLLQNRRRLAGPPGACEDDAAEG